jgi:alginate O-acetyltransferase complex protein AlgI
VLFTSIEYLIFLFLLVSIYFFLCPHKYRVYLLIFASLVFYSFWGVEYTLLLILSIIILYTATVLIDYFDESNNQIRFWIFFICLIFFISILGIFKYLNFIYQNMLAFFALFDIILPPFTFTLTLPLGISFFTFMAISYLIDVYHREYPVEKSILTVILYISFFPHLMAGPIMRAKELIPQFKIDHKFNEQLFFDGLKLIIWGLFKKMVIADRLSGYVNLIYATPTEYSGLPLLMATFFFTIQIYCDFSGYCDIAIGSAQMFGYRLPDNFNRPYFSTSIGDFWRRWHKTLYSWFRDYIYIPLGGSRVRRLIWYRNILIVFVVSGLWHGAKWTYIVWGMVLGFLVIGTIHTSSSIHLFTQEESDKVRGVKKWLMIIGTFLIITLSWVFFRASSLNDVMIIFTKFVYTLMDLRTLSWEVIFVKNYSLLWFAISGICISFLLFVHLILPHDNMRHVLGSKSRIIQWAFCYILILMILFTGDYNPQNFIYFQF